MVNEDMIENAQDTQALTPIATIKAYMSNTSIKSRFNDILGDRANGFMASIVTLCSNSKALAKCEASSIMNAAFIAASLDLPIDPNLGFAAIVPYGEKAQFQMMYKGFVQLAIRSAQYKGMNVSEVYQDEIESYNPITGEITFNDFKDCTQRKAGDEANIAGYYAWFTLINGFNKPLYMDIPAIDKHAGKYSQSYKKDLRNKTRESLWETDKHAMRSKTVLKLLLSKWGILNVQMQQAIQFDQAVIKDDGTVDDYVDNKTLPQVPASKLDNVETVEA